MSSLHINSKNKSLRVNFVLTLLLSGDINPNPGPSKSTTCPSCLRTIAKNHRFVSCTKCSVSYHIKCAFISPKDYTLICDEKKHFNCATCINDTMPFPNDENSLIELSDSQDHSLVNYETFKDVLGSKGLKMAHLNVNGIRSKLDQVRLLVSESGLDLLCLNETKIDESVSDADISIPNFDIYRRDRNKHGGGVLIYVSSRINSTYVKTINLIEHEIIWLKLTIPYCKPIFICSVYRPPSHGSDLAVLDQVCSAMEKSIKGFPAHSEIFIFGDLNCNLLLKNNLSSRIKEFSRSSSMTQHINCLTRVTSNSSTLIDVLLSNSFNILKAGVFEISMSDHYLIYATRKIKKIKPQPKIINFRSFKNFNPVVFLTELKNNDWSCVIDCPDLDCAIELFTNKVLKIANKHAPLNKQKVTTRRAEWITEEFLKDSKKRDYLKKKASQSKSLLDWKTFTKQRNKVNRLNSFLKKTYVLNKLTENDKNPKKNWKTLKHLVSDSSSSSTINSLIIDNTRVSDKQEIANHFNDFFSTVGANLASKFKSSGTENVSSSVNTKEFFFTQVHHSTVYKMIQSLSPDKATGIEGIGVKLLKAGNPILSKVLAILFNRSLSSGHVPKQWKVKRVSPLHKGDEKDNMDNYRPISIMSISMKLFEKIVHDQLSTFINSNNILITRQSGFRKSYSTSSAVVDVADFINNELSNNKYVCATLIDLRKAFDTVDHRILLKKLFCYGIRDTSFSWFESYLSERQQLVSIDGILSDLVCEMAYGVPQGSVLGPLLFLLYINDISSIVHMYHHLYADDTIIVHSADNPETLKLQLEIQLKKVEEWLKLNKLTINTKKCEILYFGNKRKLSLCKEFPIVFCGKDIAIKEKVKYLGVIFDEEMSWVPHINTVRKKVGYKISKIMRINNCLNDNARKHLVNALIMPYYRYCNVAWVNANKCIFKKLEKQYDSIKRLYSPKISLPSLLAKDIAIFTFRAVNKIAPSYVSDKISLIKNHHNRQTRQNVNNHIFNDITYKNKFSRKIFKQSAINVWNSLPPNLTNETSLLRFKTGLSSFYGF
jgi:exonuclease III